MGVEYSAFMDLRFPQPASHGSLVGVTSPSRGVPESLRPRLEFALGSIHEAGFEVRVGSCMDGSSHISAPADQRAAELQEMLLDPQVRIIIPPWGGETAIDLIPLLDWSAIAEAQPTWVVGYSDISTLLAPLTLRCGWATVHAQNLMDTPYNLPGGLTKWTDVVRMERGSTFTQAATQAHQATFIDFIDHPEVVEYGLSAPSTWTRLDTLSGDVNVSGRLIGGCIEVLAHIAGTDYLDTRGLASFGDGVIVYLEAAEANAMTVCRALHGMRLNGLFDGAAAILIGRTDAPDCGTLTQHEAAADALAGLGVPIIMGVDCGHSPPQMTLVNGARCEVEFSASHKRIRQTLS